MPLGKGGSIGNQSGSSSGSSQGTTAGINYNESAPVIGQDWMNAYNGALGSAGQQSRIDAINSGFQQNQTSGYYGLSDLARRGFSDFAAPNPVTAQNVSSGTAAQFMAPYQQGYTNDVVNATLNNFDRNTANQLNANRASRDASGAFGDRAAIADNQFLSDQGGQRAQLQAGLLDQGYTRALGAGQTDQAQNLAAQNTNAANNLAAQQFNNTMTNQRQQFDVGTAFQGDAQRRQALIDQRDSLGSLLNLGTQTFGQRNGGINLGAMAGDQSGTNSGSSTSKGGGLSIG